MQRALVNALASCAAKPAKLKTCRFLAGLSRDELQFIAEFLGSVMLESPGSGVSLACRIAEFHKAKCACNDAAAADQDHKTMVLLEYLRHSGLQPAPIAMRAGQA